MFIKPNVLMWQHMCIAQLIYRVFMLSCCAIRKQPNVWDIDSNNVFIERLLSHNVCIFKCWDSEEKGSKQEIFNALMCDIA